MKLTTKQDIEAPVEFVWQALTDFAAWERLAMRKGCEVLRTDAPGGDALGMAWSVRYTLKGQPRVLAIRIAEMQAPQRMAGLITSKLFEGRVTAELMELSARRTRVVVATEATPLTLAARLVLQSMKLAKSRLQRRYDGAIALHCEEIGRRFASQRR